MSPHFSQGEELRRSFTEDAPLDLVNDIRLYEEVRSNKIRDQHIAYAKSVSKALSDGESQEYVADCVTKEVPYAGMDITLTVQYLNYFLEHDGHNVRFDEFLNMTIDGEVIIASGATAEHLMSYAASLQYDNEQQCKKLAEGYGQRMINGYSVELIMQFAKNDLVWESLDNALFAEQLNTYLEVHGSEIRFNQYLVQI